VNSAPPKNKNEIKNNNIEIHTLALQAFGIYVSVAIRKWYSLM
jgi:hypothetical protein